MPSKGAGSGVPSSWLRAMNWVLLPVSRGVEGAHQPLEGTVALRGQAEFLGELLQVEAVVEVGTAALGQAQHEVGEVAVGHGGVDAPAGLRIGVAGGGDEVGPAQVPVEGARIEIDVLVERLVDEDFVFQVAEVGVLGLGVQGHERVVVAVDLLAHRGHADADRLALPQQFGAAAGLRAGVDVALAVDDVVDVARDRIVGVAHAQAELVFRQGHVGAEADVVAQRAAALDVGHAAAEAELALGQVGLAGDVLEQAAHRAGAVQGALRAAQDFDPRDVVRQQVEGEERCGLVDAARAHRHLVDVGAHGGARGKRRDAPHREDGLAGCSGGDHLDAGQVVGEIGELPRRQVFQLLRVDHADRGRDRAHVLFALVRGDDDRFEFGGRAGRVLRGRLGAAAASRRPARPAPRRRQPPRRPARRQVRRRRPPARAGSRAAAGAACCGGRRRGAWRSWFQFPGVGAASAAGIAVQAVASRRRKLPPSTRPMCSSL